MARSAAARLAKAQPATACLYYRSWPLANVAAAAVASKLVAGWRLVITELWLSVPQQPWHIKMAVPAPSRASARLVTLRDGGYSAMS